MINFVIKELGATIAQPAPIPIEVWLEKDWDGYIRFMAKDISRGSGSQVIFWINQSGELNRVGHSIVALRGDDLKIVVKN